jgi:hypothetical protein
MAFWKFSRVFHATRTPGKNTAELDDSGDLEEAFIAGGDVDDDDYRESTDTDEGKRVRDHNYNGAGADETEQDTRHIRSKLPDHSV